MDYDHSQTRLRLVENTEEEYVSPLKAWFSKQNPLNQQAELEKERMQHRIPRAKRYLSERVFQVGDRPLAAEKSLIEGTQLVLSSFLSGFLFLGFLSTPLGCFAHALRGANMHSETLFKDMLWSGMRVGIRNGVAYGTMLAVFRGTNYGLTSASLVL